MLNELQICYPKCNSDQLTATKMELCDKNAVLFSVITGGFGLLVGKLRAI